MATMTRIEFLSAAELAERIEVAVHPSLLELGPRADGMTTDRLGGKSWHPKKFTRLELPASRTGFGVRWIDYATAAEAMAARDRVRRAILTAPTPEAAWEMLNQFYRVE